VRRAACGYEGGKSPGTALEIRKGEGNFLEGKGSSGDAIRSKAGVKASKTLLLSGEGEPKREVKRDSPLFYGNQLRKVGDLLFFRSGLCQNSKDERKEDKGGKELKRLTARKRGTEALEGPSALWEKRKDPAAFTEARQGGIYVVG